MLAQFHPSRYEKRVKGVGIRLQKWENIIQLTCQIEIHFPAPVFSYHKQKLSLEIKCTKRRHFLDEGNARLTVLQSEWQRTNNTCFELWSWWKLMINITKFREFSFRLHETRSFVFLHSSDQGKRQNVAVSAWLMTLQVTMSKTR